MSADRELERRLRELRAPDEERAEQRSWDVVRAAYAERTPAAAAPIARRVGLALAACAVLVGVGLSPAGAKVGDLVSEVVGIGSDDARPTLRSLPAPGELLVESEQGPWIVREDGSKRLLGDYAQASWSRPRGLYVAATSGRELLAVEPSGDVRWTISAPGIVRDPRWSPSGYRIAYRSGDDLRVVDARRSGRSARRPRRRPGRPGVACPGHRQDRARWRRQPPAQLPGGGRRDRHAGRRHRRAARRDAERPRAALHSLGRGARGAGDLAGRQPAGGDRAGRTPRPAGGLPRRARPRPGPLLRARSAQRADLVARRRLAAGRLAPGRPVAVHPHRPTGPRRRLRPDLGAVFARFDRAGEVPASLRVDPAGALSRGSSAGARLPSGRWPRFPSGGPPIIEHMFVREAPSSGLSSVRLS